MTCVVFQETLEVADNTTQGTFWTGAIDHLSYIQLSLPQSKKEQLVTGQYQSKFP